MTNFCKNNHEMTVENTYIDPRGYQYCRICEKERSRKRSGYKGNLPTGQRTHCPQNHEYNQDNTFIDSKNQRHCKLCHKLHERRRRGKTENVIPHKERTHCPANHEYNEQNTSFDKEGHRHCRTCRRLSARERIGFQGYVYGNERTHCKYNHALTSDNIYIRTDNGSKICRICHLNYHRKRNDIKAGLDNNYSVKDEQITREIFNHCCFNCDNKENLSIDHHYPLNKGFGLSLDNAVLLCRSCNTSKSNKLPQDFYSIAKYERLEYLLSILGCEDLGVY